MKPSIDKDSPAHAFETVINAQPSSQAGLMLLGGQVREVYFAAIGKQRVVWRKAYCLSKVEAVEEAERFHHAAKHGLAGILRRQRERQLNITHWSEQLSHRALQYVTKALGRNPANVAAELMKTLLHSRDAKEADQVADCHRIGFIQRGARHRFARGMIVQQRAL